jgi:hypothetical protein
MHQTSTAVVALNEDRIITVRVRPGVAQTVADAEKNLAAALQLSNGDRRAILVDIRDAVPLDGDVRRTYAGPALAGFSALALLIKANPLGRMIGNVYLSIANTPIPTRLFTDEVAAIQWLKS